MSGESARKQEDDRTSRDSELSNGRRGKSRPPNAFLMNKHPELFEVRPRPGGYFRQLAPRRISSSNVAERRSAKSSQPTSSSSVAKNVEAEANIGDILETRIRCPNARAPISQEDKKNNAVRMCSVAISTVMLLAQHIYEDVTVEHAKCTEEYFSHLRQADGYPHNIGQLLKLLTNLKKNGRIAASVLEEENEDVEEYKENDNTTENDGSTKKERRVSIASKDILDIQPVVYSFKGTNRSSGSGSVITAALPPQWLYHDHVVGVIWMIFHKDKYYVGISQLQWCLKFLLDLKNAEGEYTGDVEICIQAIEDDLIEQYAKLGPALEKSIQDKTLGGEKGSSVFRGSKLEENKHEDLGEIAERTTVNDVSNPGELDEADSTNLETTTRSDDNDNNTGDEEASFVVEQSEKITGTSTPNEKTLRNSMKNDKSNKKKSEKECNPNCMGKERKEKKEEIFSFTYNEMMARGPAPCTDAYSIKDNCSREMMRQSEERINLAMMDPNAFVNFLNTSTKEEVEKLTKDTETLRILERLMKNIKNEGLVADSADNFTKRLDDLQRRDVEEKNEETTKMEE